MTMFHHSQLPATPLAATSPVTSSGVSAANVVATIEAPGEPPGNLTPRQEVLAEACASPRRGGKKSPIPVDSAK